MIALLFCLVTPVFTAAAYLMIVGNFPTEKRYSYLAGGLFLLPVALYVIGRFLWMFCVPLERVE